jgi:hypothetical protein
MLARMPTSIAVAVAKASVSGEDASWVRSSFQLVPSEQVDKGRRHARGLRLSMEAPFKPGQPVRVNLAGMQVEKVTFHAAVTDAVGNIVKQTSDDPPKYLVRLLFSFRGINEVEVPADRIRGG